MANDEIVNSIRTTLLDRFGETFAVDAALPGLDELAKIAGHRSHRRFAPRGIEAGLLRLLCACALSAPSKSDLQQCDIVIVSDMAIRKAIVATIPDMPWILDAPVFLVFTANGARLPALCKMRGRPFPNDHLDQFFNAAVDTGIVLATFIQAAAAIGLGCCPISAIRDHPQVASGALNLYSDQNLAGGIDTYDRRRAVLRPYRRQRNVERWGETQFYGWSEDKARQYAEPTRTDFGAFVRRKGFRLD
jgi:nitroreductase